MGHSLLNDESTISREHFPESCMPLHDFFLEKIMFKEINACELSPVGSRAQEGKGNRHDVIRSLKKEGLISFKIGRYRLQDTRWADKLHILSPLDPSCHSYCRLGE